MSFFIHLKTNELLRDKFKQKKEKNPSFSIRSWAQILGMSSHGALQQILAGKRTVPKKYIPKMIKSLGLTPEESLYFETLVDFEKSKTVDEQDFYYNRLASLRPQKRKIQMVEIENYKYFQNPLHSIIRTMTERSDFRYDLKWIKNTLRIKTTEQEIKEVITRLIALNLLIEKDGTLVKTHSHITNTIDVPSEAVQSYHQKMSYVAAEQVKKQSVTEREYNSYCINLKNEQLKKAQEKIRSFVKEFMEEFEATSKESNLTYQFNLQLFSLSYKQENNL